MFTAEINTVDSWTCLVNEGLSSITFNYVKDTYLVISSLGYLAKLIDMLIYIICTVPPSDKLLKYFCSYEK